MSKVRLSELNVSKIKKPGFCYGTKRSISFSSLGNRSCQFWKVGTQTDESMNQQTWTPEVLQESACGKTEVPENRTRLLTKVLPNQLHQMQHL